MGVYIEKKSPFWQLSYSKHGERQRESSKIPIADPGSRERALQLLGKRKGEIETGIHVGARAQRTTIDDLLSMLESDYRVKEQTWEGSMKSIVRRIRAELGAKRKAVSLSTKSVNQFRDKLRKTLSPASVNRHLSALGRAYRLGIDADEIATMPKFHHLSEAGNERGRSCTLGDLMSIISHMTEAQRGIADLTEFAMFCGRRLGQLCKLLWSDVIIENGEPVRIRFRVKTVKNRRPDVIPLTAHLKRIIVRRQQARVFRRPKGGTLISANVFSCEGRPILQSRVSRIFSKCATLAGHKGLVFHSGTRASFMTEGIRAGISLKVMAETGGWRTLSVAAKYQVVENKDREAGLERVAAAFNRSSEVRTGIAQVPPREATS